VRSRGGHVATVYVPGFVATVRSGGNRLVGVRNATRTRAGARLAQTAEAEVDPRPEKREVFRARSARLMRTSRGTGNIADPGWRGQNEADETPHGTPGARTPRVLRRDANGEMDGRVVEQHFVDRC